MRVGFCLRGSPLAVQQRAMRTNCGTPTQFLHGTARGSSPASALVAAMIKRRAFLTSALAASSIGLALAAAPPYRLRAVAQTLLDPTPAPPREGGQLFIVPDEWAVKLLAAAERQIGETVIYDPSYVRLDYPGGDVPRDRGVCTDVVIRAYRDAFSLDLQRLVHRDMVRNFSRYPTTWAMTKPDRNIDHRRVLNLETYFKRAKARKQVSDDPQDYLPGDIVSQRLGGKLPHMAIVSHRANADRSRPQVIHNIGAGTRLEDTLFEHEITGHFRFRPA